MLMFVCLTAIKWASRWDQYLKSAQSDVQWFSIVNSVIIVIFLTGMIGVILVRTLHRDITRYNQVCLNACKTVLLPVYWIPLVISTLYLNARRKDAISGQIFCGLLWLIVAIAE